MELIENGIYERTDSYNTWCHHGIVFIKKFKRCNWNEERFIAVDTYWNSNFKICYTDSGITWDINKIKDSLEFIMMIDDIKEVREDEFLNYNNEDRLYIPTGGLRERYLVNKNASPNIDIIKERLQEKIRSEKYKIESFERAIKWYEEELRKYDLPDKIKGDVIK